MIHFDLIFIVLLMIICAAILGGIGGWCLARRDLEKKLEDARWQGSKEYFDASQDYQPLDFET
jgi:membrane protein YqaA with SNARE-associated domain